MGIEIAHSNSGVVMSQRKYVLDILEKTGILDCKPVEIPMHLNVELIPGQGEPLRDLGRYQRLMGRLNYLTITRPDISFPMNAISQFLQSPCDSHQTTQSTSNHSVFYHHTSSGHCIYLIVYVDDIVITGSDHDGIQKLKQHLFSYFQTKDLGKLKYFLGIELARSNSGVVMYQRKYVLDILEEIGMLDCKPVDAPMDPNVKLVPGQGELL